MPQKYKKWNQQSIQMLIMNIMTIFAPEFKPLTI